MEEGSSHKKTLTVSLVSVLIVVVLLTCGVYYSWRRNNRLSRGNFEKLHTCLKFFNLIS
jgi:ABC-type Fe3+ transport system permease subunit